MKELLDMSQSHLMNVKNEITKLANQKEQLDKEIERLTTYLEEGTKTLEKYRSETAESASTAQASLFS